MMPNKTIYVKYSDLPLFEHAQELLGDSVSSMFAEFLKERVGKLAPKERMVALISQISRRRADLKSERSLPQFIDGLYAEAEAYAKKAVKNLRSGEIRKAKAFYYAANVYHAWAERDAKDAKEVGEKITELVGGYRCGLD
jgi:hypothetical protein